ncbi:SDR family NAD(P)-dependent oxidoreductase [Pseudomonas sp. Marseille-QA0332]
MTCRLLLLGVVTLVAMKLAGCASGPLKPEERARLAAKTFVVTGASSGIGRGVALELARSGANVVVAARRTAALESLARQIRTAGGTPLVVTTDVADSAQMQRLAQQAMQHFGQIHGWINNAGVVAIGRFEDIPLEDHQRLLDINLKGTVIGSHLAMKQFRQQRFGVLVNVASIDSEVPHTYQASYSASKAGVLSLGRVLNQELRLHGPDDVHVVTVLPWALDTPLWDHAASYTGHQPQLPTMDGPEKAVNAIVRALFAPKEEITVGYKAKLAYWNHRLAPDLNEYFTARALRQVEVQRNPPAPATSGNLHHPVEAGQDVSGGIRERMKRQEQATQP